MKIQATTVTAAAFVQPISMLVCHRRNDLPEQAIGFFGKTGKDGDKGLFANFWSVFPAIRQKNARQKAGQAKGGQQSKRRQ
ncbi:MAG: hypothetical protein NTX45_16405 [Proteobacteria bacterium]|nr:hypothetical protein [Pseudomonadota bacterium]